MLQIAQIGYAGVTSDTSKAAARPPHSKNFCSGCRESCSMSPAKKGAYAQFVFRAFRRSGGARDSGFLTKRTILAATLQRKRSHRLEARRPWQHDRRGRSDPYARRHGPAVLDWPREQETPTSRSLQKARTQLII